MSYLNDLISQLCPKGVPYVPISELGTLTRGKRFVHADAVEAGIPCIHYGELYTYYGIYTESTKSFVREDLGGKLRYAKKNDVIIVGAGENDIDIGIAVAYLGNKKVAIHDACYIFTQENDPKYISYCLRTDDYHNQIKKYVSSGKICAISAEGIGKARLPIPPIEVQREIVKILDKLTLYSQELASELSKEITQRKQQYEYYRDSLLEFNDSVPSFKLGDVCTIKGRIGFRGYTQKDFVAAGEGAVSLSPGNIIENHLSFEGCRYITWDKYYESPEIMISEGDIVLCKTGSTVGKVAIVDSLPEKATLNPQLVVLKNIKCNPRYLFYQLSKCELQARIRVLAGVGSVPNISQKALSELAISVPSIEIQNKTVTLLDRIDNLCKEINEKISTEVELRGKQYKYYRDKVLEFEEA